MFENDPTKDGNNDPLDFSSIAEPIKKKKSNFDEDVPRIVDDELVKLGYSPNARLSFLGDVGRENSWKKSTIFGGHSDPKNKAFNRGIISWQGDRRVALDNYLKKEGVLGRGDESELRAMVRFADTEMKSNNEWKDIAEKMRNPNISTSEASEALRKYIKYVPHAPYNTPDANFRVEANAKWAKRAKQLGLAQPYLDYSSIAEPAIDFSSIAEPIKNPQDNQTFNNPVAPIDPQSQLNDPNAQVIYPQYKQVEGEQVTDLPLPGQTNQTFPNPVAPIQEQPQLNQIETLGGTESAGQPQTRFNDETVEKLYKDSLASKNIADSQIERENFLKVYNEGINLKNQANQFNAQELGNVGSGVDTYTPTEQAKQGAYASQPQEKGFESSVEEVKIKPNDSLQGEARERDAFQQAVGGLIERRREKKLDSLEKEVLADYQNKINQFKGYVFDRKDKTKPVKATEGTFAFEAGAAAEFGAVLEKVQPELEKTRNEIIKGLLAEGRLSNIESLSDADMQSLTDYGITKEKLAEAFTSDEFKQARERGQYNRNRYKAFFDEALKSSGGNAKIATLDAQKRVRWVDAEKADALIETEREADRVWASGQEEDTGSLWSSTKATLIPLLQKLNRLEGVGLLPQVPGSAGLSKALGNLVLGGEDKTSSITSEIARQEAEKRDIERNRQNIIAEFGGFTEFNEYIKKEAEKGWIDYAARVGTEFGRNIARTGARGLKTIGIAAKSIDDLLGTRDEGLGTELEDYATVQLAKSIEDSLGRDPYIQQTLAGGEINSAFASALFFLAGGYATKGSKAAIATLGSLLQVSSMYDELIQKGVDETTARNASLAFGIPLGASEIVGIGGQAHRMLNKLGGEISERSFQTLLRSLAEFGKRRGKDFKDEALDEGLQEWFQSSVGQSAIKAIAQKDKEGASRIEDAINRFKTFREDLPTSAVENLPQAGIGAIVGGVTSVGQNTIVEGIQNLQAKRNRESDLDIQKNIGDIVANIQNQQTDRDIKVVKQPFSDDATANQRQATELPEGKPKTGTPVETDYRVPTKEDQAIDFSSIAEPVAQDGSDNQNIQPDNIVEVAAETNQDIQIPKETESVKSKDILAQGEEVLDENGKQGTVAKDDGNTVLVDWNDGSRSKPIKTKLQKPKYATETQISQQPQTTDPQISNVENQNTQNIVPTVQGLSLKGLPKETTSVKSEKVPEQKDDAEGESVPATFDVFRGERADGQINETYGGVSDAEIGTFYTDNPTMAEWFAGNKEFDGQQYSDTDNKKGNVKQQKVSLKKPYVIDANHPNVDLDNDKDSVQEYFRQIEEAGGVEEYRKQLEKQGYDGIVLADATTNYYEDGVYSVVIEFNTAKRKQSQQVSPETPKTDDERIAERENFLADDRTQNILSEVISGNEYRAKDLQNIADEYNVDQSVVDEELNNARTQKQTDAGNESTTAIPASRTPQGSVAQGKETSVRIPQSKDRYTARYEVRELEDIYPSHNPFNFQPNPDYFYGEIENERKYDENAENQRLVEIRSKETGDQPFDEMQVVNNNPTAETGSPIIDEDGNVWGGNSRTMIIARVYKSNPEGATRYKNAIIDDAEVFGLDVKAVAKMKKPVLVRVLEDSKLEEAPKVITDLNKTSVTQKTQTETALANAKNLSLETITFIANKMDTMGSDATLYQALDVYGNEIVNKLIDDGIYTSDSRNVLFKDNGNLTPDAKSAIERMLIGRLFRDSKQIKNVSLRVKSNLSKIVAPLAIIEKSDWSLTEQVKNAIDMVIEAGNNRNNLDTLANQASITRNRAFTETETALAKAIAETGAVRAAKPFKQYAGEYQNTQTGSMFGTLSREQAFREFFDAPFVVENTPLYKGVERPAPKPPSIDDLRAKAGKDSTKPQAIQESFFGGTSSVNEESLLFGQEPGAEKTTPTAKDSAVIDFDSAGSFFDEAFDIVEEETVSDEDKLAKNLAAEFGVEVLKKVEEGVIDEGRYKRVAKILDEGGSVLFTKDAKESAVNIVRFLNKKFPIDAVRQMKPYLQRYLVEHFADKTTLAGEKVYQNYYDQALENLKKTSRTVAGILDTSASKGKADQMADVSGQEAAKIALENFKDAFRFAYDNRNAEWTIEKVDELNKLVNKGIVKDGVLDRNEDSEKYPYTRIANLEKAKEQFGKELKKRLADKNANAAETAAWIEWRVNLTDHFYADGGGKTSKILAAVPLMKTGEALPVYGDNKHFFAFSQDESITPDYDGKNYLQDEWNKFFTYYRTLIQPTFEGEIPKAGKAGNVSHDINPLNLKDERLSKMQDTTLRRVLSDPQKYVDRYYSELSDKVFNVDEARLLFDEFLVDPLANVQGVHEASALVTMLAYKQKLDTLPKGSEVLLLAGGAGSGKTFSSKDFIDDSDVVLDGVMKNTQSNREMIDLIKSKGLQGSLVFVHREVAISAKSMVKRWKDEPRIVPIPVAANGHYYAQQAILTDTAEYAEQNDFAVTILDNIWRDDPNDPVPELSIEELKEKEYNNVGEVEEIVRKSAYQEYEQNQQKYYDERIADALEGGSVEYKPNYRFFETGQNSQEKGSDTGSGTERLQQNAGLGSSERDDRTESGSLEGKTGDQVSAETGNLDTDQAVGSAESSGIADDSISGDLGRGQREGTQQDGTGESTSADAQELSDTTGSGNRDQTFDTGSVSSGDIADGQLTSAPANSNFRITNELDFDSFSPKKRFRKNVEAIQLVKQLENENRKATVAEQEILAQYVGFGGLKQAFDSKNDKWAKEYNELKDLLTDDEYRAANRSILDAHYTSKDIVQAIWNGIKRLGFKQGEVLEPTMGTGNFIGLMKGRKNANITGVELDSITSKIAKQLYPKSRIFGETGFQDVFIPENSMDVAVGNPPFGSQSLFDKTSPARSKMKIHAMVIAKSIDSLKPGGVLGMVVSKGFLDANDTQAQAARKYIADRAELLGAVRLPNNAFLKNANTQVVTDLVFFRKFPDKSTLTETEKSELRQLAADRTTISNSWSVDKTDREITKTENNLLENPFYHLADKTWLKVGDFTQDEDSFQTNRYFIENPGKMLGVMEKGGLWNADEGTLKAIEGQDLFEAVQDAILDLPENAFRSDTTNFKPQEFLTEIKTVEDYDIKPYNFGIKKDKIFQLVVDKNGVAKEIDLGLTGVALDRAKGMIGIRATLRELIDKETDTYKDITDAELLPLRKQLEAEYDNFQKKFGFINDAANKRVFKDDADYPLLQSLEPKYDKGVSETVAKAEGVEPREASAKKADIFRERVNRPFADPTSAESAQDALILSKLNRGEVDIGYMLDLYDTDRESLIKELGNLIFLNPASESFESAEEYLSGDVKTKLTQAEKAAESDPAYKQNVRALEKVIPKDVTAGEIFVRIPSPWIPIEDYSQFARDLWGGTVRGNYSPQLGRFTGLSVSSGSNRLARVQTYGIKEMPAEKILEHAMTNSQPTVWQGRGDDRTLDRAKTAAAQAKVEEMQEAFTNWIWRDDERRTRLVSRYNDLMNRRANRDFDGSHYGNGIDTIPGLVLDLRPHILNAVWRMVSTGKTLLNHVVGAGKTPTMITAGMEMKRLGKINKPMYVVMNATVGQWSREFKKFFPNANILVADKSDFSPEGRKQFFGKIATGNWDAVIVAHSQFKKIPVPKEVEISFVQDQIAQLAAAINEMDKGADRRSVRDMQLFIEKLQEKLDKIRAIERDELLNFAEMGIDALFVDEAHQYKNLFYTTTKRNVAGLGDPNGSQQAFDMFMKTQMLLDHYKQGVFFATGTPVSNSLVEVYTMLRYLQKDSLEDQGLNSFDSWANTYGQDVLDWELNAAGQFKEKTRFTKFANLPELKQLWDEVVDTITNDQLKEQAAAQGKVFPIPKVDSKNIVVPRSKLQAKYIGIPEQLTDENGDPVYGNDGMPSTFWEPGSIVYRSENWQAIQEGDDPYINDRKENPLRITTDARKAGLDYRLIDDTAPDYAESKLNVMADEITKIWEEEGYRSGTQLVFMDMGIPKSKNMRDVPQKPAEIYQQIEKVKQELQTVDVASEKYDELADKLEDLQAEAEESFEFIIGGRTDADGNPIENNFSVYDELRRKLMAKGIPADEIAYIHDYNTDLQKSQIFDKVNKGEVRILFGSTHKLGTGVNVNKKLVAIHHGDAPWKPSWFEQRNGRGIRQGNEFWTPDFTIKIRKYGTEKTYDARMYEINEIKGRALDRFHSNSTDREMEDVSDETMSAAEMKAEATGDPRILKALKLDKEIKLLDAQRKSFEFSQFDARDEIRKFDNKETWGFQRKATLETAIVNKEPKTDDTILRIGDKDFKVATINEDKNNAIAKIAKRFESAYKFDEQRDFGEYRGFKLLVRNTRRATIANALRGDKQSDISVVTQSNNYVGKTEFEADGGKVVVSLSGLIRRLDNIIDSISDQIQELDQKLADKAKEIDSLREAAAGEFPKQKQLDELKQEHADLLLDLRGGSATPKSKSVDKSVWESTDRADEDYIEYFDKTINDFREAAKNMPDQMTQTGIDLELGNVERYLGEKSRQEFERFWRSEVAKNANNSEQTENEPDALKKLADEVSDPKLTMREMADLQFADLADVLAKADLELTGDRIRINAHSHELYRRTLEELRIKSGTIKRGSTDTENMFAGAFLDPAAVKKMSNLLTQKFNQARKNGVPMSIAKTLAQHATALDEAAKVGKGTAILFVFDSALPEELFHQADYLGAVEKALTARHSRESIPKLDNHRVANIAWDKHFSKIRDYQLIKKESGEKILKAVLRAETAPWVLNKTEEDLEKLGITPEQRADYLLAWMEGYAEKNGVESLQYFDKEDTNVQEFIEKVKEGFKENARLAEVRETRAKDSRGKQRSPNATRGSPEVGKVSRELSPNERLASLPKTLRKNGIEVADLAYEVFGDEAARQSALSTLNREGVPGALTFLDGALTGSNGQPDADTAFLSFMMQRMFLERANQVEGIKPDEAKYFRGLAQELANKTALSFVAAGRYIRAASVISHTVEGVLFSAEKIMNEYNPGGGVVPPNIRQRIETLGREREELLGENSRLGKDKRNLQAQILRLKKKLAGELPQKSTGGHRKKLVAQIVKSKGEQIAENKAKLLAMLSPDALKMVAGIRGAKQLPDADVEVLEVLKQVLNTPTLSPEMIRLLSEQGALILIEQIDKADYAISPTAFEAEMTAQFGNVIDEAFDEIYEKAFTIRDKWLAEAKNNNLKQEVVDRIKTTQFTQQLTDWEIQEILGESQRIAERRKQLNILHQARSKGRNLPKDFYPMRGQLTKMLVENDLDFDAVDVAMMRAEGLTKAQIYAQINKMESVTSATGKISDKAAQNKKTREIFREGNKLFDEAKAEVKLAQRTYLTELDDTEKQLQTIADAEFEVRTKTQEVNRQIGNELRRIKDGEFKYRASQVYNSANALRTLMASFDLSASLRQGGFFTFSHPKLQKQAYANMVKSFKQKGFGRVVQDIEQNPLFIPAKRLGIDFAEAGRLDQDYQEGEEYYRGNEFIRSVPILGWLTEKAITGWSERTYTAFLDSQRMMMFEHFAGELLDSGFDLQRDEREFKKLADFINIATGRGTIPKNKFGKVLMELPLFAPRYTISRLQLLGISTKAIAGETGNMLMNPISYWSQPKTVRRQIARSTVRFYGVIGGVMAIAHMIGLYGFDDDDVLMIDPDSSDFLKIKIGNARYDLFAGTLQPARMLIRMMNVALKTKMGTANRTPNEFGKTLADESGRFVQGKLSPIASLFYEFFVAGEDYNGKRMDAGKFEDWYKAVGRRLIPLMFSEIYDGYNEGFKEPGLAGAMLALPSFVGIGASVYDKKSDTPVTEAEKLSGKFRQFDFPPESDEEKAERENRTSLRQQSMRKEVTPKEIDLLVRNGTLSKNEASVIKNAYGKSLLEFRANRLSVPEILKVWDVAESYEQSQLKPIIIEKVKRMRSELTSADIQKLRSIGIFVK